VFPSATFQTSTGCIGDWRMVEIFSAGVNGVQCLLAFSAGCVRNNVSRSGSKVSVGLQIY